MIRLYALSAALQAFGATIYPYTQILLRNLGLSQSIVGIILALTQLSACIFPLLVSNYADKSGKTKLLYILSSSLVLLNHFIFLKWSNLAIVFVCNILIYACTGSMSTLSDMTINLTLSNRKIKGNYAGYRATGTLAYVLTLILFTLFQFPNTTDNTQILSGIATSTCILIFFIFVTPNPVTSVVPKEKKQIFFDSKWFSSGFYFLIVIVFIKSIGNAVIDKLLGSYMTEVLNLGTSFTIFVALGAFTEFLFMLIFGKKLKEGKITEFTLIKLSCLGLFLRLALYSLSANIVVFTIAQLFHCLTFAASHIAMISFISKYISKEHIGLATAIYQSFSINCAQFIGSLGGGFIIDYLGYPALFKIYMIFPAIGLILCFINPNKLK